MSDEPPIPGYSLVMPFVVVHSKGGPFDDQAFAAGWECGTVQARLQHAKFGNFAVPPLTVHRQNLPQLDLIGMELDAVMMELEWDEDADIDEQTRDEWAMVQFLWVAS